MRFLKGLFTGFIIGAIATVCLLSYTRWGNNIYDTFTSFSTIMPSDLSSIVSETEAGY